MTGRGVLRFSHAAMATTFEVRCVHEDARYAGQAARAAFELVDRLEREQSRFLANSDVSRIGELKAGQHTRVSAWTLQCLEIACRMYEVTGGAFDVSRGTGLEGLELIPDDLTVRARTGGVHLDLGGIGKGYAVDRMAELLEEWDVSRALIHGGWSSVLALEPPPGSEGWALTLSAPEPGEARVLVRLAGRQKALSASGTRKGDHIVDPRTGEPAAKRAVWVAVERGPGGEGAFPATVAETLSTALMLLSPAEAAAVLGRCGGAEAWLYDPERTTHLTSGPIADNDAP